MAKRQKTGGRQKGTPNKATVKKAAVIAAIEASGLTPLDFLVAVMRNTEAPAHERMDAAKAAAPYMHAKLAAMTVSGPNGGPIETLNTTVSNRDRAKALLAVVAKAK